MNLVAVVMLSGGVILMYAAVKGKDPRDVVGNALGKKDTHAPLIAPTEAPAAAKPSVSPLPNDGTQVVSV
jgi:hypothetical protein